MGSEWKTIKLQDFADHQKGFAFKSKDYIEQGIAVVRVSNLTRDSIDCSDLKFVSEQVAQDKEQFRLSPNDVVIATVGSWPKNPASVVGKVIRVPEACDEFLLNQNAVRFRAKSGDDYDQLYLYYLLKSKTFSDYIVSTAQGSANQASITLKDIYSFEFNCPTENERRRIALQLSSLDDKTALNTQINQTLEQMAQTLFKSWFVDFDPVIDNALDAGNLIPEVFETRVERRKAVRESADFKPLPDDVRQLFPSEFEESELGWVPKGWAKGSLAEQTSLIGGGTPKRSNEEFWGGKIPWFSVKDAPSSSDVFVIDTDEKITELGLNGSSTKMLPLGTTIISARGTVGKLALVGCEMAMNQSCYGVQPKDQKSFSFNYFNLKHAIKTLQRNTHGAVFDTITKNTFETVETVIPPQIVLDAFESYSTVWLEKIKSNLTTSASLAKLRDILLPKLISGELRLDSPEVEQVKALVD